MRQYNQLTQEQRYQISAMKQAGAKQVKMANQLGVSASTISRELKRNGIGKSYRAERAHKLAESRSRKPRRQRKICGSLQASVNARLKSEWSPEQISGWLKNEEKATICPETIYDHVRRDRASGGKLFKHLRRCGKAYKKRGAGKRQLIPDLVSIDERPAIVDERLRIGDWEGDTIFGAGQSGCLLVMVERFSRYTVIAKCEDRTAKTIRKRMLEQISRWRPQIHTITVDNGREFTGHKYWGKRLKADVYFAHPYSPWERGLSEQTNGLVRQYLPKKKRFTDVTQNDCRKIMEKLNTRPRKCLGYRTPRKVLWNEKIALRP